MATLNSRLIGSHGSPQHAATRALAGAFISLSLALLLTGLHEATAAPLALAAIGLLASFALHSSG